MRGFFDSTSCISHRMFTEGDDDTETAEPEPTYGHLIVDFPSTASGRSRCISFACFTQVHFVENYSIANEKQSVWYDRDEIQSMYNERDLSIRMLQRFIDTGRNDQTLAKYAQLRMHRANTTPIGLEDKVQYALWNELINRRENHRKAVLVEQWRGVGEKTVRVQDSFANISRKESEWARKRARAIGMIQACDDCVSVLHAIKDLNSGVTPTLTKEDSSGFDRFLMTPATDVKPCTSGPIYIPIQKSWVDQGLHPQLKPN
jgi:hypothetical protein